MFSSTYIFLILITGLDGLRDVKIEGPSHVRINEDVLLRCNYKLENESIYVVKWYRFDEKGRVFDEFYRYLPKEVPPKRFFPGEGLLFDERYCNEHEIFMKNVSLETSGLFKCAISAEITFQTFVASLKLLVIAIEDIPPTIDVEQFNYYTGETVKANCSVGKVSTPVDFTWFINGKEVPKSMSKTISMADGLYSKYVSLLSFEMGTNGEVVKGSLNGDDTRLKCRAELLDLYSGTSGEIVIQTMQPRYSPSNQDTQRQYSQSVSAGVSLTSIFCWRKLMLLVVCWITKVQTCQHC